MSGEDTLRPEELRRRLEEAEETLRAIREGEIDALVIRRAQEEEILTLEGPESFRSFMEAMNLGAAALDSSLRLIYANRALADIFGTSPEALQAAGLFAALDGESAARLRAVAEAARAGRESTELRIRSEGSDRHLLATATPLQLGATSGIAVTFTDLTERLRVAQAEAAEQAARAIITSANEAVVVCDADGIITHINPAVHALCGGAPVGRAFRGCAGLRLSRNRALPLRARPAGGGAVGRFGAWRGSRLARGAAGEGCAHQRRAARGRIGGRLRGDAGGPVPAQGGRAAAGAAAGELDHRVRNTLALVLSISTLTGHNARTVDEFQRAFVARIEALAATHTLLSRKAWSGLSIADVVAAELAPYVRVETGRLAITGLDVTVTRRRRWRSASSSTNWRPMR